MTITLTIKADCDPPPVHDQRLDEDLADACDKCENALADAILNAGGSFSIESDVKVTL